MNVWEEIFTLYKDIPIQHKIHIFLRIKLSPFEEIIKFIPNEGEIIELGCGHGVFSNLMALTSERRSILGIDIDRDKIEIAKSTVKKNRKGIKFQYGNIIDMQFHTCQAIVIIDVFYLLPFEVQEKLLQTCFEKLNPYGKLIIKEVDTTPVWKYWMVRIEEFLAVKVLNITKGDDCYFRGSKEFVLLLSKFGFNVRTIRLNKGIAPHILYVCEKKKNIISN
jgi:2-polyprenyl-6-hydroxyphenyl methylase/3-demethylubiquinone-9 3-methyltransferase